MRAAKNKEDPQQNWNTHCHVEFQWARCRHPLLPLPHRRRYPTHREFVFPQLAVGLELPPEAELARHLEVEPLKTGLLPTRKHPLLQMAPREMAPEEMAPEEMAPGEMAPGEMAPGEMAPGEMYPSELLLQ